MQLVPTCCFAEPTGTAVHVDPLASNMRAHHFYERLGFLQTKCRLFGADDYCLYRLERDALEAARPA